jgi:hypothetical protein
MSQASFMGEASISFASAHAHRKTLYFATVHATLKQFLLPSETFKK